MEQARRATAADLLELERLWHDARRTLGEERDGSIFLRKEAALPSPGRNMAELLDATDAAVFLGTLDQMALGMAVVRRQELGDATLLASIDTLYVEPEGRAVGLGETLMTQVLAWASSQGCQAIDSFALPGDRETKNFFETNGLKARLITVHRKLETDACLDSG